MLLTGPGPSPFSDSRVRVFKGNGTFLSDGFLAFPESAKFGVKVSIGNIGEEKGFLELLSLLSISIYQDDLVHSGIRM
jgi:hypothetical protein